jgi:4-amino-4-deoxy-L-arabinose transferase-like glycosyltransferase
MMPTTQREAIEQRAQGDWAFTASVAVVALLPRLFVAIAWAREPVWDAHYYHFGAERIAEGLGYSEDVIINGTVVTKPWVHYPVGYSALLGMLYKVFGTGLAVAPTVNALIGALTVLVVHRLAMFYVSRNRARVAAGLAALHPGLIAYTVVVMTEGLAALLLLVAGFAALRWRGRWLGIVFAGAVLGLAALVRPSSLLAAPLLALTQPRPWFHAGLRAAVALGLALVVVSPWTIRNCMKMDGCALVSTNGGWNLAIGALTDSGRFKTLRAADGCAIVTGQVQQDRCWAKIGREVIAKNPTRWIKLMPKKLGHTFDHESFAIEYLHEADPASWPEARRTAARHLLTLFHRLLLIAAALSTIALIGGSVSRSQRFAGLRREWVIQTTGLIGIFVIAAYAFADDKHPFFWLAVLAPLIALAHLPGRPAQGPAGRYLLGLVAATALTHAIFFGDDRYHIVVAPVLCILAAAALRAPKAEGEPEDPTLPAFSQARSFR